MILVDSSVWIDLFGPKPKHRLNENDLRQIAVCPPVLQEVLQGVRDDRVHARVATSLQALPCLGENLTVDTYLAAADLFRVARKLGKTVRSSVDCLIAVIAKQNGATIWHDDRYFEVLGPLISLPTMRAMQLRR